MFTCSSVAGQLICDSRRQSEMSARKKIVTAVSNWPADWCDRVNAWSQLFIALFMIFHWFFIFHPFILNCVEFRKCRIDEMCKLVSECDSIKAILEKGQRASPQEREILRINECGMEDGQPEFCCPSPFSSVWNTWKGSTEEIH